MKTADSKACPFLSFGVGLRTKHYPDILEKWPKEVDWFEVISENFMIPGGRPLSVLDQIAEHYPIVMHGVSMSIGSTDPLDFDYLKKLKQLADRCNPKWISDHTCWSSTGKHSLHDLMPIPQTEEAAKHVIARVRQVQDFLERKILLENVSSYMEYHSSSMTEWEFVSCIAEEADCNILLDINNIFVSAVNHEFDPHVYLNAIDPKRVGQFHLAGHSDMGTHLLDTHDHHIRDEVWKLYDKALERFGDVSTLIEWDDHIPPFDELLLELTRAKERYHAFKSKQSANA
ncbi:MAG: hypothetical protein COX62_00090 [Deltaproteobacteria bacterium CG_4_10_14_0_2_um_filter_43_8]|nr:MAG: hypothetical protein COV43_09515 [Deltaproteobacteria bacterium CG11_big_fil_rev_8_21_14_0_20_42_23]PJA22373.1 MAG: hypothetical protein COX62_00090 [Deltaproteobacteria bacterium CG_4_10_14_0_2_um_filter_43_8]PJC64344.1 MAG: hypothetical protein CO021_04890 [Deltaproteobacteria bacterium CG_4_9_14_0_2_um_filter_42_21]